MLNKTKSLSWTKKRLSFTNRIWWWQ